MVSKTHQISELFYRGDQRGDLFIGQIAPHFPFQVHRFFFIKNVPSILQRGGHCLKSCKQALICLSGTVDITLKTPSSEEAVQLSTPNQCLFVPALIWREMSNFSSDSILLVLASTVYDESDYIREWHSYCSYYNKNTSSNK
jgi:hypothetical protein